MIDHSYEESNGIVEIVEILPMIKGPRLTQEIELSCSDSEGIVRNLLSAIWQYYTTLEDSLTSSISTIYTQKTDEL